MMNWALVATMLVICLVSYKQGHYCFLTPTVVISGVMAVSATLVAINTNYWCYTISFGTYLLITASVLMLCVGHAFGSRIALRGTLRAARTVQKYELPIPPNLVYYMAVTFALLVLVLYFRQQYSNAASIGMAGSLSEIVYANRYMRGENATDSSVIRLLFISLKIVSYILLVLYIKNRGTKTKTHTVKTFIVVALYLLCCLLSSNRSDIIAITATLVFYVFYFNYQKNNWNTKATNKKTVMIVVAIVVAALTAFRLMGNLTGKSERSSLYDNICVYAGSPIVCLDMYLSGSSNLGANFEMPLMPAWSDIFSKLGIGMNKVMGDVPHQYWYSEFGVWGSNIYSSLFPFYVNFGALGLLIYQFFFGALYGILWKRLKSQRASWSGIIIYGDLFFYYICMYSIAERLVSQLFTLTGVVEIMLIIFFTHLLAFAKKEVLRPSSLNKLSLR